MKTQVIVVTAVLAVLGACGSPRQQTSAPPQSGQQSPPYHGSLESAPRAHRALPRSTARANPDKRRQSRPGHQAGPVAEEHHHVEGHQAAGCGSESGVRPELRRAGAVPAGRLEHGEGHPVDDASRPGVHRGTKCGVRCHPAAAAPGGERRDAEGHAAAGGLESEDVPRRGRDRDRTGQSPGGLRPAIQLHDRLHAGAGGGRGAGTDNVNGHRRGRQLNRSGDRGGVDRVHGRHCHRGGDGQPLLLRAVRLARRRVHVQRRVGRLLGPPRGRARRLDGSPRRHHGGARRLRRESGREPERRCGDRTARRTAPTSAEPRTRRTQRTNGRSRPDAQTQPAANRAAAAAGSASASYEARGYSQGTPSTQAQTAARSGGADAFSGYSSGRSTQAASSRGERSRSSSRGGGGGRRR